MRLCFLFLKIKCSCFALLQDNFSQLHERTKELPETVKQLGRLFPNKVSIQPPQVLAVNKFFFGILHFISGPNMSSF